MANSTQAIAGTHTHTHTHVNCSVRSQWETLHKEQPFLQCDVYIMYSLSNGLFVSNFFSVKNIPSQHLLCSLSS